MCYPEHLQRNGRPVDSVFDPNEYLYRRFKLEHVYNNNQLLPTAFNFPNCSVNREKYGSEDIDVLRHQCPKHLNCGVAKFMVQHIPETVDHASTSYSFIVHHVPLEDNFPHSEIRAYELSDRQQSVNIPSKVRKKFKEMIARQVKIVKYAEV